MSSQVAASASNSPIIVSVGVRWRVTSIALVVGLSSATTSDATPTAIFSIGGSAIYPRDLAALAIAAIGLSAIARKRSARLRWPTASGPLLLGIAFLTVVTLGRGYIANGPYALVEARQWLQLGLTGVGAYLAVRESPGTADWALSRVSYWVIALVVPVFLSNLMRHGLASSDDFFVADDGSLRTLRPLVADQALAVGIAGIVLAQRLVERRRARDLVFTTVAIAVVLICQHRSVWLATAFGLVIVIARANRAAIARLTVGTFFAGVAALALLFANPGSSILANLSNSITSIWGQGSTLEDRTWGWRQLVAAQLRTGPQNILFGVPWGSGYSRIGPNGLLEVYTPHNTYVVILLRLGLVGLVLFAVLATVTIRVAWHNLAGRAAVAGALGVLVYLTAYGLSLMADFTLAAAFVASVTMRSAHDNPVTYQAASTRRL